MDEFVEENDQIPSVEECANENEHVTELLDNAEKNDETIEENNSECWDSEDDEDQAIDDAESEDELEFDSENNHPKLNCSVNVAIHMILTFYLKHNLSWVALEDLLLLFNVIVGGNIFPKSKFLFKKRFNLPIRPQFHYYCPNCTVLIEPNDDNRHNCENCNYKFNNQVNKSENFFVTLPILTQVQTVLQRNSSCIKKKKPSNLICDINDGSLYKEKIHDENTITLTLNTDGVKIFKSTKKGSFWPIQFVINELHPNTRFENKNIIVCGFWFGKDPNFDIFFKPLIQELHSMKDHVISITTPKEILNFNVRALSWTVDTIAKDKIQMKKQFNGYDGCSYCFHHGERVEGHQIRYTNNNGNEERTHITALDDMTNASDNNIISNGFKGLCPLVALPEFDVIKGFVIDPMHCVFLGVVRQIAELWFDSSNHGKKFYIGLRHKIIDEKMSTIKPPIGISRKPRSITERHMWKASEWRTWLFFYSLPCLYNTLPQLYLEHFCLLAESIYTLSKETISTEELFVTDRNISEFVKLFQHYYGKINMVYNVHLLLHLPKCVLRLGPLWGYSNFCFENNNGVLMKYVRGKTDVSQQIVSKYCLNQFLHNTIVQNQTVTEYFDKISRKRKFLKSSVDANVNLIGKAKPYLLNEYEKTLFPLINGNVIHVYDRVIYKRELFHSSRYCKHLKSDDSTIQLKSGKTVELKYIFLKEDEVFIMVSKKFAKSVSNEFINKLSHIVSYDTTIYYAADERLEIFSINEINSKKFLIKLQSYVFDSEFPNNFDKD